MKDRRKRLTIATILTLGAAAITMLTFLTGFETIGDVKRFVEGLVFRATGGVLDDAESDNEVPIKVFVDPPDSSAVYLDGRFAGSNPVSTTISAGSHSVFIYRPGCEAITELFQIGADETRFFSFELECNIGLEAPYPLRHRFRGVCPFEGCVYREWSVREQTPIYRRQSVKSGVSFWVSPGDWVRAVTGDIVTIRIGTAVAGVETQWTIDRGDLRFEIGEICQLFSYRGEGQWLGWCGDAPVMSAWFNQERIREEPETVWWIQVVGPDGRIGWTNQPDNFGNKDLFG